MRILLLALGLLLSTMSAFSQDLYRLRTLYLGASDKEETCQELIDLLENNTSTSIKKGYKGVAYMIMAKHCYNPYSKYSWFSEGKVILEEAISADYSNTELRYLRLGVQENTPGFLGYSSQIESDIQHLIKNLPSCEQALQKMIVSYLLKSENCSESDKSKLRQQYSTKF